TSLYYSAIIDNSPKMEVEERILIPNTQSVFAEQVEAISMCTGCKNTDFRWIAYHSSKVTYFRKSIVANSKKGCCRMLLRQHRRIGKSRPYAPGQSRCRLSHGQLACSQYSLCIQ